MSWAAAGWSLKAARHWISSTLPRLTMTTLRYLQAATLTISLRPAPTRTVIAANMTLDHARSLQLPQCHSLISDLTEATMCNILLHC